MSEFVREEVGYWDTVAFYYFPFTVQVLFLWGVNPPLTRMYSLLVYKLVFFIYFFFWMILNKNRAMIFTTTTIFCQAMIRNLFNRPSVCNPQLSRIYNWMFNFPMNPPVCMLDGPLVCLSVCWSVGLVVWMSSFLSRIVSQIVWKVSISNFDQFCYAEDSWSLSRRVCTHLYSSFFFVRILLIEKQRKSSIQKSLKSKCFMFIW